MYTFDNAIKHKLLYLLCMAKSIIKSEVLSIRIDAKTKKKLEAMASDKRRKLSEFIQLTLVDIAEGKIKISL